jgi:hypothetical protein
MPQKKLAVAYPKIIVKYVASDDGVQLERLFELRKRRLRLA